MKRHLVAPIAALVLGLAGHVAHAAPGQSLSLEVTGPDTNGGKVRRCQGVAYRHGFTLSDRAPVHVTLLLARNANHLTVTAPRGVFVDSPKPGWGMDQLCEDAMREAERAYAEVGHGGPPPGYAPPSYAPPPSSPPPSAHGGPPTIFLNVVGPASNPSKFSRCMNVAQRRGVVLTNQAPMRVTLELGSGFNRLKIHSARRGEIYNQPKPGWGMEQLCEDAIQQVMMLWDGGGPPAGPGPAYAPPPPPGQPTPAPRQAGYALGPIPPSKELAPPVKQLAETAVHAWQSADFEGALRSFHEAHTASNDPQFLFDQAVCEQRLTRYNEALQHTQQFLDRAPQSPYRPYAEQLFGELQHAMGND